MGLLTFLIIDTADERVRLQSFGGLLVFLLLGWIFSKYPSRVNSISFLYFFCELSNKLTISFFCYQQGDMETCDVGHDAAVDIWSNRLAMGLWSKSFRMSGSESHNFSRLHQRRIKFRLRLLGDRSKHVGHSLGNHICLQSKLSDMLLN